MKLNPTISAFSILTTSFVVASTAIALPVQKNPTLNGCDNATCGGRILDGSYRSWLNENGARPETPEETAQRNLCNFSEAYSFINDIRSFDPIDEALRAISGRPSGVTPEKSDCRQKR